MDVFMRDKNGFLRIAALFQDPVAELLRTLRDVLPTPSTPQAGATTDSASWTAAFKNFLANFNQELRYFSTRDEIEFVRGQFMDQFADFVVHVSLLLCLRGDHPLNWVVAGVRGIIGRLA
jgi:hypothetical protein